MESRTLQFVADACGGRLLCGAPGQKVSSVCSDSRALKAGDVFLALSGERFDGHAFLAEAVQKGASAVIAEETRLSSGFSGCAVITVGNTRQALGLLASRYRADFDPLMIAVGGSNGKTTTKEILASVLSQRFPVLRSEASFNNDIGVPSTLLKLESAHKAAVLEAGTNHPGELAPLVQMIRPKFSVLTSIGREHLEFFGDMTGVVKEEGALAELLPGNGRLFVNADSEWVKPVFKRTRATVIKVGLGKENDFSARNIVLDERGVLFSVSAPDDSLNGEYRLPLHGRHQVTNALLAVAVAAEAGLGRDEIRRGLAACQPPPMRMQVWSAGGITVLDDAYNANADSMLAALQTLKDFPCRGRRIAVLGDMAELGRHTAEAHREVGRRAAELKTDHLFAVGVMGSASAEGAVAAGMSAVTVIGDVGEASKALKTFLREGDVVLIKASRSSRLERIGRFLKYENAH